MPEQKRQIERRGGSTEPLVHHYPEVRGGVCEWCGTVDDRQPAVIQYTLCSHFKGMGELQCSYCPQDKDPMEVTRSHTLNVWNSPTNPNEVVVCCSSTECEKKHQDRFRVNRS